MENQFKKMICVMCILYPGLFLIVGCEESVRTEEVKKPVILPSEDLGARIGTVAEVLSFDVIPVKGYGLVGGLKGAGSPQCPPNIRAYLKKYITQQVGSGKIDVDKLINSPNTAVVLIEGMMPTAVRKAERFDIRVTALADTQTTSLDGGNLLGADLYEAVVIGTSLKVLAKAEGPLFINKIGTSEINHKSGYILDGGEVLDVYKINLALKQKDYKLANQIRNLLNGYFEKDTATAISEMVSLKVPAKYSQDKQRFISLVKAIYLVQNPELTQKRTSYFLRKLAVTEEKYAAEIAFEAIGKDSLDKLKILLNSSNEQVRLRAARCMLNLESDNGLSVLREIAMNTGSVYRIEALKAIAESAKYSDALSISRRLLADEDFTVQLAAYENLLKLEDIMITRELIAEDFYLEQTALSNEARIFVSRSGQPRIALFGAPIYCRENVFIQSGEGNITINAPAGQEYITIIRKHPSRPLMKPIKLQSSFKLSDIIRTLCGDPVVKEGSGLRPGLGVSYSDVTSLLKQMHDNGAIDVQFHAGPLPKIE